ncbi:uncharacterized protein LOC114745071 [Neltuma alba]|uniref:uncharacterized protein LOC114745071 n=1 Tax=Neltuma alba TaxID=207710 RepID=UPI0010A4AE50|nr:uncharacterized protein LOC114745071 [Prosopis alba]
MAQRNNANEDDTRSIRDINNTAAHCTPKGFYANAANFEIKGSLISALPRFYGLAGNDAYQHLDTLYSVCSAMKPPEAKLEDMLMKVFHFSLEGGAKEWLHTLPQHYATLTWEQLQKTFLDKYFPASRISKLRKAIYGISQRDQESLYDYWTRYLTLINRCPNHQCSKSNLVQYFYEGLLPSYKMSIDAAANGSIFALTPNKAWELLETMANSNQQFYTRDVVGVSEVTTDNSQDMLVQLLSKMDKRLERLENERQPKACNAVNTSQALVGPSCIHCASPMHTSETCPAHYEDLAAMYPNRPNQFQQRNPFSNTYNEGWRDHPNLRWREGGERASQGLNRFQESRNSAENQRAVVPLQGASSSKNDENLTKILSTMEELGSKLDCTNAVTNTLNEVQAKIGGVLPSNTVINPKSLNAITLRSGKQVKFATDDKEDYNSQMLPTLMKERVIVKKVYERE